MNTKGNELVGVVRWIDASRELPDDEMTVMIAFEGGGVWTGFRDAGEWRCVDGELVKERVTHWGEFPDGPALIHARRSWEAVAERSQMDGSDGRDER